MIYILWAMSVAAAFWLGYKLRDITTKIEIVQEVIKEKIEKPPVEEQKSFVVDPLDPVQEALYEHKKMMEKLNPHD